jgi:hypothetical protein
MSRLQHSNDRGVALVDVVVVCAVSAVIGTIAIPTIQGLRERDNVRSAAQFLGQRMQHARLEALKRNVTVAFRFDPDDLGRVGSFVDGDGDGVTQRDIDTGTDYRLAPDARLDDTFDAVRLQIASDLPEPEGGGTLAEGSDPVRIGSTNLVSFSPLGSATSGTIYLAGQRGLQACVRIMGSTGRMRVLWFDPGAREWRQE